MLKRILPLCVVLSLGACASTERAPPSGFLTSYQGMEPKSGLRHVGARRTDEAALARVRTVAIRPSVFANEKPGWMTDEERARVLRQVDAKLCFELTEVYALASMDRADAIVRVAVTDVEPTGQAESTVAAAANFMIPGPIGLRPGGTGALSAEAEMIERRSKRQIAALSWNREATAIGTDNPSLSRIGDALQFANKFGNRAGKVFKPRNPVKRRISADSDPCKVYGSRFRMEGFVAKTATGLYIPELSAAKDKGEAPAVSDTSSRERPPSRPAR